MENGLLGWFRQPKKCGRAVERLGKFLLGGGNVRTSVKGITLSCMTSICLYEPSVFRLHLTSCDRPVSDLVPEFIQHTYV